MKLDFESNDFVGREKELGKLIQSFNETKGNKTQFVVLEADTGIGKTRLIQELYHYLTIVDDENDYWPDNLEDTKHTMTIIPEFDTLYSSNDLDMPWLWIALRCQNKDERNSYQNQTALSQIRKQVRLHLGGIIEKKRKSQQNITSIKSAISLIANYAFPGSGSIVSVAAAVFDALDQGVSTVDSVKELWNNWLNYKKQGKDRIITITKQEYTSLIDQTLDIFSVILANEKNKNNIPLIFIIDDAQWADQLTLEFIKRLLEIGTEKDWPLLILATCWESSVKEQTKISTSNDEIVNFGQLVVCAEQQFNTKRMKIEKLNKTNIKRIISFELKNLNEDAKTFIAHNCSGDLELLWDYIIRIKNTPGYLNKEGKLNVPIGKLNFRSNKKKELAREKILELGQSVVCLLAWGSAQGIKFSKSFIDKCVAIFKDEFNVDISDFYRLEDSYNITTIEPHQLFIEVSEFKRRLYYEVAREILEDIPQKEQISLLLIEFYKNVITQGRIKLLDYNEQISIYEEFRHLIKQYSSKKKDFLELNQMSGIKLVELYLREGLFERCIEVGEDLLDSRLNCWTENDYKHILSILIEASFGIGDTVLEGKYIELYSMYKSSCSNGKEDVQSLLYKSKYHLRCDHMDKAIELAGKAVSTIKENQIDVISYKCYEQLIVSYFYAGQNQKGFKALKQFDKKFRDFFNEHERLKIYFDHNVALLCHNIDANLKAVARNLSAKKGYEKLGDQYNYMLSCVNLADAYMGVGRLKEAEKEIENVYKLARSKNWKHAYNIAALCYGNILAMQGNLSEAFHYYDEGISLTKKINHNWDLLYGLIWRALGLADFGDPIALDKLFQYKQESEKRGYHYLSALSATFYLLATEKLGLENKYIGDMLKAVNKESTPGLYAQAVAAYLELNQEIEEGHDDLIQDMLQCTLECEGIKGRPQVISKVMDNLRKGSNLDQKLLQRYFQWKEKFIDPITQHNDNLIKKIQNKYGMEPKIKRCGLNCEAVCCYDGVYLLDGEEENIKEVLKLYPQYFRHLPKDFIVDGNWRDLMTGRKTAIKTHQYKMETFPAHFEQTRCVFAYDNGLCSLQKAATDLDFHPWKFKPKACWVFPLRLDRFKIFGPPKKDEQDPDYVDETYPGYSKFVPCGKHNDNGESWVKVYRQELCYLDFVLKKN